MQHFMPPPYARIAALLSQDRAGYTLPQALYVSEEAYRFDVQVLLKSLWLYAGTIAQVKRPGDWFVFTLGTNEVIIVRGKDGEIRAFHNTCRHRGARICAEPSGHAARLACPYHFWTYGLDGALIVARGMAEGFSKAEHGLVPVAIENVAGLLFVCLADTPPPFGHARDDIAAQVGAYDVAKMKVAVQDDIIEPANWKLVMENNRECYHCESNHPELLQSLSANGFGKGLPEDAGEGPLADAEFDAIIEVQREHARELGIETALIEFPEDADGNPGWHRVARLPLAKGAISQTLDGKPACRLPIWAHGFDSPSSLSVWTQPNSWHHFCADHVVTFALTPLGPDRTLLRTTWLVHEDAVAGEDYDPDNLAAVWRATNAQDSHLCAITHAGVSSDGYRPGPYSLEEKLVDAFKTYYVGRTRVALAAVEHEQAQEQPA